MIGAKFIDRDGAPWQVVAADGGRWIISRTNAHVPVQSVTAADLAENFTSGAGVPPVEPEQPDEQHGWSEIGRVNATAAEALALGHVTATDPEPTPEDHFQRIAAEDAKRLGHR